MVGWPGFEPGTNDLKGRCSTIELPTHIHNRQFTARGGYGSSLRAFCNSILSLPSDMNSEQKIEWETTNEHNLLREQ